MKKVEMLKTSLTNAQNYSNQMKKLYPTKITVLVSYSVRDNV